jgi:hypothetical protein
MQQRYDLAAIAVKPQGKAMLSPAATTATAAEAAAAAAAMPAAAVAAAESAGAAGHGHELVFRGGNWIVGVHKRTGR